MTSTDNIIRRLRAISPALALVAVLAAVFLLLRLTAIVLNLSASAFTIDMLLERLMLPASASALASRPWTVVTYMFVHYDVLHLLMNLLWLYMFAAIAQKLCSRRSLIYLLFLAGGIAGAVAFILAGLSVTAVQGRSLTGASAAILAVMAFTMMRAPGLRLRLVFFGETSLKIVGLIAILLVVISTGTGPDSYGLHAAHAAGFVAGVAAALILRRQPEPRMPIFVRPATQQHTAGRPDVSIPPSAPRENATPRDIPDDSMLDMLLDKIRRSGYNSLSPDERRTLFTISSKLRDRQ